MIGPPVLQAEAGNVIVPDHVDWNIVCEMVGQPGALLSYLWLRWKRLCYVYRGILRVSVGIRSQNGAFPLGYSFESDSWSVCCVDF